MSQPLSIESKNWVFLITTRTAGSRLWFVNNPEVERRILGALARYQEIHEVKLFGFVIMGNHYHLLAQFPKMNRAKFMRDFNSAVARIVGRACKTHGRRAMWARRYANQAILRDEDIRHWFFYVALNPVSSGLVARIHDYPSYNSFADAIAGVEREFKWVDWSMYLQRVRYDSSLKPEDFERKYTLRFSMLPGSDEVDRNLYRERMNESLRARQSEIVEARKAKGKGFLGVERLRIQQCGSEPRTTKTSTRRSRRPLILTLCPKTRHEFLNDYFAIKSAHSLASTSFLSGDFTVIFPIGTYPPPGTCRF